MRKANQEITDPTIINEILSGSTICRLGISDKEVPYVLPFNYGYFENHIYIHCATEGKKINLLRSNPDVCFEIEYENGLVKSTKACSWSTIYRSVVGYGRVEIVTDTEQKRKGLEIIMAQHGGKGYTEFEAKQVDAVHILKLRIDTLTAKQSGNWDRIYNGSVYSIESDRLVLNEITWDDLERLHAFHSIPEVERFNTIGIPADLEVTRELMRHFIEDKPNRERKAISWTIRVKESNDFIGEAGMSLSADRFKLGEIFYNLHPSYWNLGYGTEVARRLIRFGFETMALHKVEAGVATENERSVRVLEKCDMTREGLRRKILPIRGEWVDNYHYGILESDQGKK